MSNTSTTLPNTILRAEHLRKSFGDVTALNDINLALESGRIRGFIGANGAGKTTTMRIIMGVLSSDGGQVTFNSQPITSDDQRSIGYMPEERGLYPKMKVAEQVTYFGQLAGMTHAEAKESAEQLLQQLDLTHRAKDSVQDLSLGNQQRVQLAVSLVASPDVLILDEPFSGLDPIAVDVMSKALTERAHQGVAVLFSSHQLDLVERICDSVTIVSGGKIIADGTVEELKNREESPLRLRVSGADDLTSTLQATSTSVTFDGTDYLLFGADDAAVLDIARQAGRVTHFAYDQRSIADIFHETVKQ